MSSQSVSCQSGRRNCARSPVMGSRCVLHHTRRLAVRRHIYFTQWYKRFEKTFTEALSVRFQLILLDEPVPSAEEFVVTILLHRTLRANHTAALAEIVTAVDRRAKQCRS